jgi:pimeloyl-ACP methyl ester carboxylesterase
MASRPIRPTSPRHDSIDVDDPRLAPLSSGCGEALHVDDGSHAGNWGLISVPTITLEGDANGAAYPDPGHMRQFAGKYADRTIAGGVGHNLPLEAPEAFARAVIDVNGW